MFYISNYVQIDLWMVIEILINFYSYIKLEEQHKREYLRMKSSNGLYY